LEEVVRSVSTAFWKGKRVFLTGHTGFKGAWLSLWLARLGAEVHGFALPPPTDPSLFEVAGVASTMRSHVIGDIRDRDAVMRAMAAAAPDIVLHLAAQPLVRLSYAEPLETFETNVMGTANVLHAAGAIGTAGAFVSVTTDKCYENKEWLWAYRENEPLGGRDPYSASKACAELVTAAWRASFGGDGAPATATARAGNVIGGGDWALDRIVPDAFRALDAGCPLMVRHPQAIRPWQHVLEPLAGYLLLAERLYRDGEPFASAWNFGPAESDAREVGWILDRIAGLAPELRWDVEGGAQVHEARFLKLDSSKARAELDWAPRWSLETALAQTVAWHQAWRAGTDMQAFSHDQIDAYSRAVPA
jgi:CDP-glucose 4,6-dehydratase